MKLSALASLDSNPSHIVNFADHLAYFYRMAETAERLGYTTLFLFRNLFNPHNSVTDPLMLHAALARSVSSLRLGAGFAPFPHFDPVALAETCATLDGICQGRLTIAIDEGVPPRGSHAINLNRTGDGRRNATNRELFRMALRGERFSASGTLRRTSNVRIAVPPVQAPHPPIHVAVYDRQAAAQAGSDGFGIFIAPLAAVHSTGELEHIIAAYRSARTRAGHQDGEDDVIVFCLCHAQDEVRGGTVAEALPAFQNHAKQRPHWLCRTYDQASRESYVLFGDRPALAGKLDALDRIGVRHVAIMPTFGGIPAESALRTMAVMATLALTGTAAGALAGHAGP